MTQLNDNESGASGVILKSEEEESEEQDNRVDYHLSKGLEHSVDDETRYHLREALSLLRL